MPTKYPGRSDTQGFCRGDRASRGIESTSCNNVHQHRHHQSSPLHCYGMRQNIFYTWGFIGRRLYYFCRVAKRTLYIQQACLLHVPRGSSLSVHRAHSKYIAERTFTHEMKTRVVIRFGEGGVGGGCNTVCRCAPDGSVMTSKCFCSSCRTVK